MPNQVLSSLTRTMQSFFRIGNVRLKDASGVVQARNSGDTAFADVAAAQLRVQGANATNAVILNAPAALGANVTFVLPNADGATGDFLKTNGAGTLSFTGAQVDAEKVQSEAFTQATSSPLTVFTPANGTLITKVQIEVTAAGAGGSPTAAVGVSGTTGAYMATTENDLKEAALYEVEPNITNTGQAVILTLVPSAQTFTGVVRVWYAIPG